MQGEQAHMRNDAFENCSNLGLVRGLAQGLAGVPWRSRSLALSMNEKSPGLVLPFWSYCINYIPTRSSQLPIKQKKGCAIFYSNDHSDIPYLIFIYDAYTLAEYRLVSFKDTNLPAQVHWILGRGFLIVQRLFLQMFLRLSQAVLAAHNDGRILGSDLNLVTLFFYYLFNNLTLLSGKYQLGCVAR